MDSVFDDGSKTWASVTNKLYAQTSPCLILQDVVNPGKVSNAMDGNDMRPTEVLVEVIWGVPLHGVTPSGDEISGAHAIDATSSPWPRRLDGVEST